MRQSRGVGWARGHVWWEEKKNVPAGLCKAEEARQQGRRGYKVPTITEGKFAGTESTVFLVMRKRKSGNDEEERIMDGDIPW